MSIRRNFMLLTLLAWAGFVHGGASAQTSELGPPPLLPDLARIVERGTLVVAQLNENVPPVFFEAEDGQLAGFDIDLAKALSEQLEVNLEIRRTAESFDEVIRQVASEEVDLGISFLSRTARRATYVLFSRPYARQHHALLINRVKGLKFRGSCPSVEELTQTAEISGNLGVRSGTADVSKLREINPDVQPREFQSYDDLTEAVRVGEIAISLQGELAARRFLNKDPAARIRLRLCEIGRAPDLIGIAVPPGRYDLLHWVNVFLDDRHIDFDASEIIVHEGPWVF